MCKVVTLTILVCQREAVKCFLEVRRYVCVQQQTTYMEFGTVFSGIHWESWKASRVDEG